MNIAMPTREGIGRAREGLSWAALVAGLLLVASAAAAGAPHWPPRRTATAEAGPAEAAAAARSAAWSIGLLTAAVNGAALAWRRARRGRRRPARRIHPSVLGAGE